MGTRGFRRRLFCNAVNNVFHVGPRPSWSNSTVCRLRSVVTPLCRGELVSGRSQNHATSSTFPDFTESISRHLLMLMNILSFYIILMTNSNNLIFIIDSQRQILSNRIIFILVGRGTKIQRRSGQLRKEILG